MALHASHAGTHNPWGPAENVARMKIYIFDIVAVQHAHACQASAKWWLCLRGLASRICRRRSLCCLIAAHTSYTRHSNRGCMVTCAVSFHGRIYRHCNPTVCRKSFCGLCSQPPWTPTLVHVPLKRQAASAHAEELPTDSPRLTAAQALVTTLWLSCGSSHLQSPWLRLVTKHAWDPSLLHQAHA